MSEPSSVLCPPSPCRFGCMCPTYSRTGSHLKTLYRAAGHRKRLGEHASARRVEMIDASDLVAAFARNLAVVKAQTEGLTNADSLTQFPHGNCLNWVIGHIVEGRDDVLEVLGEPRAAGAAVERYQRGSAPVTGTENAVPPLTQLLELLEQAQ